MDVQPTASTSDSFSNGNGNGNGKLKKAKKPVKAKSKPAGSGGSKSSASSSSSEASSPAASAASTPAAGATPVASMEATFEEPEPVPAGVVVGESFDEEEVKRQTGSSGISSGLRLENVRKREITRGMRSKRGSWLGVIQGGAAEGGGERGGGQLGVMMVVVGEWDSTAAASRGRSMV